ncbi:endonuclease I family protein [Bdellovibrio reynosensis]|uniref:Endonuclease n=1 Tax=Bdellovibrio reynosensis TaxID=2835041 RepID=A0ABY4C6Y8_9BACT|nr:endonuclease [Bdellovibrio reynosensis]UOF00717.1 endonuclease [Bdellovibrio reynosensis]
MKTLLLFGLAFVTTLLASVPTLAANSSKEIPYYGEKFYRDLSSGVANDSLKFNIKAVLRSFHLTVPGTYDQIVDQCSGNNCYAHVSVGYDGARVFLMGKHYLIQHGNSYGVFDVYCDKERNESEFTHGHEPGPGQVPDNTIVNIEHTWPQSRFSGRHAKGTQKADMHHLYPTDSQLNSIRGNNNFGEVTKDTHTLKCSASRFGRSANGNREIFEPPQNHKGNVARALFYFSLRYDLPIDSNEEAFLRKWSKEDPIDEDEIRRNEEIKELQGNRNPFVDFANLEDRINDF